ncbi:hypothetical protein B1M_10573 [Burkholderia sp. TJI49]|nr:hypothetical protein B1M_10573 [Burkholderia sp. TJI49]
MFIALASLLGVVHAMLIDERVVPYAIIALVSGIVAFVAQPDPASSGRQRHGPDALDSPS